MIIHLSFKRILFAAGLAAGLVLAGLAQAQVQGISDSEILIGTHQDLSGPVVTTGSQLRDGMVCAVEDINAAGGIHGRKLRLLVEDNGYDPKKAVLATQKLVTQDRVFAIVGPLGSAQSLASMPLAIDRGLPFLFALATSDATYVPLHPLKFGLITPAADQTRAAVKFAFEKLGKRRFGMLYQDDDAGQQFLRAMETQLKVHGLTPVETTGYKRGEIEFSAQLARLKAANVDLLMLGSTGPRDTGGAVNELKRLGWNVATIAPVGAATTAALKLGGEAMEGVYVTFQFLNSAQEETPAFRALLNRCKTTLGHEPGDNIAMGYVAAMVFAEGAKNAGRTLTPQTLSQGLERVKNFKTVFEGPPISYAPGDHSPPRSTIIMQVKGGKFVAVTGAVTY